MSVFDIMDIKNQNIRVIVDAIRFEEGLTKRDIAARTNLSFATVSNLCNELIERNVFCMTKQDIISAGRTPNCISLQYQLYSTICLNLQMKDVMGLAILNIRNEVIFMNKYDISGIETPREVILLAKEMFEKNFLPNADPMAIYIGIGVAVSAIYDIEDRYLVNCAIDMYTGVPLKDLVEEAFKLPAYIDNEANLCAQSVKSGKENSKNIVYLHISEGVGVGIVSQGNLVRGFHGYGGEVAHVPVGDMEKECPVCHNYGCVENDLSVPAVVNTYFGLNYENTLGKWKQYINDIQNGNLKAIQLAKKNSFYLGNLASILINIFDPEILYIGGDISSLYHIMEQNILDTIRKRCQLISSEKLRIVCDCLSETTINIGISESIYSKWNIL